MVLSRTNPLSTALVGCSIILLFDAISLNHQVNAFQHHPFAVKQQMMKKSPFVLEPTTNPMRVSSATTTATTSLNLFFERSRDDAPLSRSSPSIRRLVRIKAFFFRMLNIFRPRKSVRQLLVAGTILLASFLTPPAIARTSGGRIGGTYSQPSRPSTTTQSRPSTTTTQSRPHKSPLPPRKHYYYPNLKPSYRTSAPKDRPPVGQSTTTIVKSPYQREIHPREVRGGDVLFGAAIGLAVSAGIRSHYVEQHRSRSTDDSPLGPGATAAFLTVALRVPDRSSPFSLLKILRQKAMTANTDSRRGLQQVVSEVSLELLRKDSAIVAVDTSIEHFDSVRDAQVAFQKASITNRSKLDRESGKKIQRLYC